MTGIWIAEDIELVVQGVRSGSWVDTAIGGVARFRPGEAQTAVRIEQALGITLRRAPKGSSYDWLDDAGHTYDAVGNFPSQFFDKQWQRGRFQDQIIRHIGKADFVPIDVSQFTPAQVNQIEAFVKDNHLAPAVFLVGN